MKSIEELMFLDNERIRLLEIVAAQGLPDCYIAAGFVRNKVWDYLHDFHNTPFNDVDVVFFDPTLNLVESDIQARLLERAPEVRWEVKNQARMHLKHNDAPYRDTADAMAHWPEKETAVGVSIDLDSPHKMNLKVIAPFGTASLFKGHISHNPKRSRAVFDQRVKSKNWLTHWPNLTVVYYEKNA